MGSSAAPFGSPMKTGIYSRRFYNFHGNISLHSELFSDIGALFAAFFTRSSEGHLHFRERVPSMLVSRILLKSLDPACELYSLPGFLKFKSHLKEA
ncbi:hypothetical protein AVEN_237472-1 [Araneus ventricosus]|uniref:Uncharacterized protein n=1 Tax=Araneus ventricosus TaxID=182803 RepID=A0A4Y2PIH3_ARAVE|nr:hypothetical protein AVEN_237472-1 [Araneus ventricosus]